MVGASGKPMLSSEFSKLILTFLKRLHEENPALILPYVVSAEAASQIHRTFRSLRRVSGGREIEVGASSAIIDAVSH